MKQHQFNITAVNKVEEGKNKIFIFDKFLLYYNLIITLVIYVGL